MQLTMLQYDLPTVVPEGVTQFPNPSGFLRRRALRLSLSVWAMDKDRTPWQLIRDMDRWSEANAGLELPNGGVCGRIRYHLHDFSPEATKGILVQAAQVMREDLEQAKEREAASLERIRVIMLEAERAFTANEITWQQHDRARRAYKIQRKAILKRSEKLVKDLEEAAKSFGMDWAAIRSQQALVAARAETYSAMAEAVTRTPVATAAQQAEIPAEILADVAEEAGMDTRAARAAFSSGKTAGPRLPVLRVTPEITANGKGWVGKTLTVTASDHDALRGTCPAVLNVRSAKTGKVLPFKRGAVGKDREGDVTHIDYDGPDGLKVRVLND